MKTTVDIEVAVAAIRSITKRRRAFTTDDVWELLPKVADGRMISNAIIYAERQGYIRSSMIGTYLRGRQEHKRWLTIWLSSTLLATLDDATAYARSRIAEATNRH